MRPSETIYLMDGKYYTNEKKVKYKIVKQGSFISDSQIALKEEGGAKKMPFTHEQFLVLPRFQQITDQLKDQIKEWNLISPRWRSSPSSRDPNLLTKGYLIIRSANLWYPEAKSKFFSKEVRKSVISVLDKETEELVGHLRNLIEHEDKCYRYFYQNIGLPIGRDEKSVRWFMNKYPSTNPYGIYWPASRQNAHLGGGTFDPNIFLSDLVNVEKVIHENVKIRYKLNRIIVKY